MFIDILTESQKMVLLETSKIVSNDFYLAGGTALALQIGHRFSDDFDWFSDKLDENILLHKLQSANINFQVISKRQETLYILINNIQISFIAYNYPLLKSKILLPEYNIYLADPIDIACMKLSAIANRGSKKDFIDFYFLIKSFAPLKDFLKFYIKKFNKTDTGHLLRALVYFEDADNEPEIKMIKPFVWEDLKKDLNKYIKEIK